MQAKLLFRSIVLACFITLGCNDNKSEPGSDSSDDIGKAATQYCDCISKQTDKVSSKLRKVIISASKEDDPETALKEQLDRTELGQEFKESIDADEADNCAKKAAKKYDLDADDKKVQKKVLAKIEDDSDCDLSAAFLRMSLKKVGEKKPSKDDPEDKTNTNGGDDASKAANEICDCLSGKFPNPSDEMRSFMKKIAESSDPLQTYRTEFNKLGNDDAKLKEELDKLIAIDNTAMLDCSGKTKDYKILGNDAEERGKRVLRIMLAKTGCEVPSGEWALGVQQTYKKGN